MIYSLFQDQLHAYAQQQLHARSPIVALLDSYSSSRYKKA
ncbi:unknown protein [Simkania negevensis Z]|uniref:Uncharacterized protein n=1 Tax=Simkania negevensis (strain ATCC VR-1471 / DSM 27360 / Z) TaxID=331113 RepID=F8L3T3_SIMNZ|nr:unknown protein [Simkania negevensis Z]